MNKQIDPLEIDNMILQEIVHDIVLNADDETLDMMLVHIWEMKHFFQSVGVVIGEA